MQCGFKKALGNKNKNMFGLTTKPAENQAEGEGTPLNLTQEKDFRVEDTSIHTMHDDLKNPQPPRGITMEMKKVPSKEAKDLSPKQKSSPFLDSSTERKSFNTVTMESREPQAIQKKDSALITERKSFSAVAVESKEPQAIQKKDSASMKSELISRKADLNSAQQKKTPEQINPRDKDDKQNSTLSQKKSGRFFSSLRLIIFFCIFIGLLLVLGWIGFNYSQNNTRPFETEVINSENVPVEEVQPALSYSETNPNYLRLEIETLDTEKVKTTLRSHAQKVAEENYSSPIEFIPTDAENKPLSLKAFSTLLELKFSPALMALLGDNFTLFIYNDITAPKFGLVIESRDDINLAKVLLQEEKKLADEISPIFFTSEYLTEKKFATSAYGSVNIRYQNIISPDTLSVDYAISENKLIIGTTKLTLRSILDKISSAKKEVTPETTIENIEIAPETITTEQDSPETATEKPEDNSASEE